MEKEIPDNHKKQVEELVENYKKTIDGLYNDPKEALDNLKKYVKELMDITDIEKAEKEDEHWKDRIITIGHWYNALKQHYNDTPEYKEAEELFLSVGNKVPQLKEWVNNWINEKVEGYKGFEIDKLDIYNSHKNFFDSEK